MFFVILEQVLLEAISIESVEDYPLGEVPRNG